jgi:hypothetical protein
MALGLDSCAPPLAVTPAPPTYQTVVRPPIGETATAQIGNPIISMAHTLASPAISFRNSCAFSEKFDRPGTGTVEYRVDAGALFPRRNVTNGVPGYCGPAATVTPMLGAVPGNHCVATDGQNSLVPFPNSEFIVQSNCVVDERAVEADAPDSIKKELLYDGKSGTTLRLSYREFVRDMARPAFTQELTYDIRDDRTIGFRDARIEVIEANNTNIRYRVLSGF